MLLETRLLLPGTSLGDTQLSVTGRRFGACFSSLFSLAMGRRKSEEIEKILHHWNFETSCTRWESQYFEIFQEKKVHIKYSAYGKKLQLLGVFSVGSIFHEIQTDGQHNCPLKLHKY